jgi:hypothetical protein
MPLVTANAAAAALHCTPCRSSAARPMPIRNSNTIGLHQNANGADDGVVTKPASPSSEIAATIKATPRRRVNSIPAVNTA